MRFIDSIFKQVSKRTNLTVSSSIRRPSTNGVVIAIKNRRGSVPSTSMENIIIIGSDLKPDRMGGWEGGSLEQT